ncbi:MAG: glycosyltransferase family 2 protein [candidate division WOR-3 bacterium]
MELSIIIINYGMENKLFACLNSLYQSQHRQDYEIIIINKPTRNSDLTLLTANFPAVRVINHHYFGIARMRNIGIKNARGEYLLMLDADTEVLDDLTSVITFLRKNPKCAAVGVKLLTPQGHLQYSCRTFYDLRTIIFRRTFLGKLFPNHPIIKKHLMLDWDHNTIRRVDWVQGAFLLMSRKAIDAIGLFDEFSPFGFEDVAWCWRAWQKGWEIYYYPATKVIHHYQRSSNSIFNPRFFQHSLAFLKFAFKYKLPKV